MKILKNNKFDNKIEQSRPWPFTFKHFLNFKVKQTPAHKQQKPLIKCKTLQTKL